MLAHSLLSSWRLALLLLIVPLMAGRAEDERKGAAPRRTSTSLSPWAVGAYMRNATKRASGSVVPWPSSVNYSGACNEYLALDPANFGLAYVTKAAGLCQIVARAGDRYLAGGLIFDDSRPSDKDNDLCAPWKSLGRIRTLEIAAPADFQCESIPHEAMNESYSIRVAYEPGTNTGTAFLSAPASWGLIRGLETFAQMVFNQAPGVYGIRPVQVDDGPRFKHRGYMLDTARHFIRVETIQRLLDGMAMNKMNVFHWHLVDDQSFPLETKVFPQLKETAFRRQLTYSQADVSRVMQYASDRGIRVLPEIDTPGHTYAMRSIPNLLTQCYDPITKEPDGDFGPIDPTRESSYEALDKLLSEVQARFPERYFHAGGDEVEFDCWKSNPQVNAWMKAKNMSADFVKLSNYHINRVHNITKRNNKTMIVWNEVFDDALKLGVKLPADVVVHVWKNIDYAPGFLFELRKAIKAGYRALLSSCWYLNLINYGRDWLKYYDCEPTPPFATPEDMKLVLGGEVCMWTEYADDTNVVSRTWPRASVAAERLWSPASMSDSDEFLPRLEQARCRMIYRGIEAEPVNGPGYC